MKLELLPTPRPVDRRMRSLPLPAVRLRLEPHQCRGECCIKLSELISFGGDSLVAIQPATGMTDSFAIDRKPLSDAGDLVSKQADELNTSLDSLKLLFKRSEIFTGGYDDAPPYYIGAV